MNHLELIVPDHNVIALSSNGVLMALENRQQTKQSLSRLKARLAEKIAQLRDRKHKVLLLVDLSRVIGYDPATYPAAKQLLFGADCDAMAIFGADKMFRKAVAKQVASTRQQHKIQFFDSSTAAARWLAGDVVQDKSAALSLAHPIWPPRRTKRTI